MELANRRLSTKDFVYVELKKKIIESVLKPGQSINEVKIALELEISRTPIREALQRLELEELIVRQPNGRLKVAPISVQEAKEIYNVRGLLEGLVTREATIKATAEDIHKLQMFTNQIMKAAENANREEVMNYGNEIHSFIYQISGNNTAVRILKNMNTHISRYRRLGPNYVNLRSKQAALEHQNIFEAIMQRNDKKAELLMQEHIHNSLSAAIESIELHLSKNRA